MIDTSSHILCNMGTDRQLSLVKSNGEMPTITGNGCSFFLIICQFQHFCGEIICVNVSIYCRIYKVEDHNILTLQ